MAFPYFELCGLKLILRHYFFPPVMQTQTVYSDLVWVQTITLPIQELLLRVQHILQRSYRTELSSAQMITLKLGDRSVNLNDALVFLPDGSRTALTATELSLLRKLTENRGHIVTYDALCSAVWGADYYGYENSLGVHIRHLRQKLEENPSQPHYLITVRGIGYKLAKEV